MPAARGQAKRRRVEILIERLLSPASRFSAAALSICASQYAALTVRAHRRVTGPRRPFFLVQLLDAAEPISEALMRDAGELPLPPHAARGRVRRRQVPRYQTVYARHDGAVAAPMTGLHFDQATLSMPAAGAASR